MSCVIIYAHQSAPGVRLFKGDTNGALEFVDRYAAQRYGQASAWLTKQCRWWEIVPLPSHPPAKPASPAR